MDRTIGFWGAMIGCLLLMAACSDPAPPPEAPKVVSQKIVVPANQPEKAPAVVDGVPQPPPAADAPAPVVPPVGVATPLPSPATAPPAPVALAPAAQPTAPPAQPPLAETAAPAAVLPLMEQGKALPQVQIAFGDMAVAYTAEGRIDPFSPLFQPQAVASQKADAQPAGEVSPRKKRIAHTPLERMDIGQFKLVAIVQAASGNRALVEDATGKGYVLVKGTYIGINSGIVIDIQKDKVIVEEETEDLYGRVGIQEKELKLQKPLGDI